MLIFPLAWRYSKELKVSLQLCAARLPLNCFCQDGVLFFHLLIKLVAVPSVSLPLSTSVSSALTLYRLVNPRFRQTPFSVCAARKAFSPSLAARPLCQILKAWIIEEFHCKTFHKCFTSKSFQDSIIVLTDLLITFFYCHFSLLILLFRLFLWATPDQFRRGQNSFLHFIIVKKPKFVYCLYAKLVGFC